MVKEIQFQRRKQTIYAMNERYEVVGRWPCRDAFVPGYNASGDPRGSLPNGLYTHVSATESMDRPTVIFTLLPEIRVAVISMAAGPVCLILMLTIRDGCRHTGA